MTCSDSENIRENVEILQESLKALDDKMGSVLRSELEIKNDMEAKFLETNRRIEEKLDAMKTHQSQESERGLNEIRNELIESRKEMNESRKEINESMKEINESRKEINKSMKEMNESMKEMSESRKEMKEVKQNLSSVTKDVDEVKATMMQMLEKMNMIEQLVHKLPSPTEGIMNTEREDILIAGGWGKSSAEIFSWKKEQWIEISPMNEDHYGASSFIHNDQLFVVGGGRTSIETLDLSMLPLTWKTFPGGFLYPWQCHQTVVYEQQILHVGGYNWDEHKTSDLIGELQLTPSVHLKELGHMTEPRCYHGVEIVDGKVLVFGGQNKNSKALSSVLEFGPNTNTCREMPPLPHPLTEMATARWRDQVLLLRGSDGSNHLNDALLYDPKTGKVSALPSMLEKRSGCCAVVTGDTVVVMGGWNGKDLDSVECFKMGSSSTWEYLPKMNHARYWAVAQVLPSGRTYVQH